MGNEDTVTEAANTVANGTSLPEKTVEALTEKKEEENGGIKEMEEDIEDEVNVETEKMDEDPEVKEHKESKEEAEEDKENKQGEKEDKEKPQTGAMEEESGSKEKEETEEKEKSEEKVAEKVDGCTEEKDKADESKVEKGSKKRGKAKSGGVKAKDKTKEVEEKKEQEQRTPVASGIERPVRERKSVERLVASIEKEAVKEFHIEKGRGTALKDIPNVAYKLSRKKTDDTFKLLHTILFGRRGKALQVKSNISRFSGFVWHENEEKQKIKVKEKFDKCVKEKLLEFCDVLDIPITKATTRKEDIVIKLIEFLVAPHPTTDELLAEKEQSSKGKKRKRVVKRSSSMSGGTPSKRTAKNRRKIEDTSKGDEKKSMEDESEEEEEENEEEETENGVEERSEDEMPEHSESEEKENESEDESEEDAGKKKRSSKKSSTKKESAGRTKTKKITIPKKSSPPPKRTPKKSSSDRSKVDDNSDISPKVFSRKKKDVKVAKERSSTPSKSVSKERTGKRVAKGKDKPKVEKLRPSDKELRNAICEILKKVDFNTATFTDILKQLAQQFDKDLTPRKSSIKLMIQEELTKLADEADDDEDGGGNGEKDETQSAGGQGVEV